METGVQLACTACGKTYPWKPHFAGKKLKCKCGNIMLAPAELPPVEEPPPEPPALDEGLYDIAPPAEPQPQAGRIVDDGPPCPSCGNSLTPGTVLCTSCGYNLATGKKMKMAAGGAAAVANPAYAGYVGSGRERGKDQSNETWYKIKDDYIPLALVAVGFGATVFQVMQTMEIKSFGLVMTYVSVSTIIDLVLIFGGLFLAARLLSLSFGPIQQAVTKVAAISLIPGAIAGLIAYYIQGGGTMIGWAASLLLYFGLFMFFFELDLNETMMCTAIIWLVRTWIGLILTIVILKAIAGGAFNNLAGPAFFGGDDAIVAEDGEEDAPAAKKPPRASPKKPGTPAAQQPGTGKPAAKPDANADPDEDDPDAEE